MPENEDADRESGSGKAESSEVTGLRNALNRYNNDAMALATELYSQTFGLREERRKLRKELEEARKKVPEEGSVVLTADQVKAWETYNELGKPDEIRSQLDGAKKDRRTALVTRAAMKHGYDQEVLNRLLGDDELVEDKGKDGETVYQVKAGDRSTNIEELVSTDWKKFESSLIDSKRTGKTAVGQAGAREGGKADYVSDYLGRVQPEANKEAKG